MMQAFASRLIRGVAKKSAAAAGAPSWRNAATSTRIKRPEDVVPNPYTGDAGVMKRQTASEYLHQRGRVYQIPCRKNGMKMVTTDILRRELLPVLPLAGMVLLAIGLGVWTFWWEHVAHPNVSITRDLRERLFEIEHPEWVKRKAAVYLQSPLRKMSLEWPTARIAHIQQEPPPPIGHGGPLS